MENNSAVQERLPGEPDAATIPACLSARYVIKLLIYDECAASWTDTKLRAGELTDFVKANSIDIGRIVDDCTAFLPQEQRELLLREIGKLQLNAGKLKSATLQK